MFLFLHSALQMLILTCVGLQIMGGRKKINIHLLKKMHNILLLLGYILRLKINIILCS